MAARNGYDFEKVMSMVADDAGNLSENAAWR